MSTVHDFEIPHHLARPTRDMVILRLPLPPQQSRGGIEIPDMFRDMAMHNVQAGRIVAMGPVAFAFKDGSGGTQKQDAEIGDWVIIRPFAGTIMQPNGKIQLGGWRYVSSFNDAIAVVKAEDMPEPSTLLWEEAPSQQRTEGGAVNLKAEAAKAVDAQFSFDNKRSNI